MITVGQENRQPVDIKGEICLKGIFRLQESEEIRWKSLFENNPRFTDKSGQRDYAMQEVVR